MPQNTLRKNYFKPEIVISLQCNSPEFNFRDLDNALVFFEKNYTQMPKLRKLYQLIKIIYRMLVLGF